MYVFTSIPQFRQGPELGWHNYGPLCPSQSDLQSDSASSEGKLKTQCYVLAAELIDEAGFDGGCM